MVIQVFHHIFYSFLFRFFLIGKLKSTKSYEGVILLPQKWMGNKIAPIPSWGGCDVDYKWQVPLVEYWLKKNKYISKK